VNDSSVSRTHAAVQWSGGTYSITDLNSTNGSWINETKLESQSELAGGELIRLGNTILKFILLVDEETQYHNIVHEVMTRDALTNTLNRGSLFPLLERELQLCREESTALSVIFLDVDQFKLVNDQHGHLVGDKVLRIFCERIRTILDSTHSLCRFGGDEFVIVCPGSELEMTVQLAELIRSEIADTPFEIQNGQLNITCSLGVTCTDGHTLSDVDSLLSAADRLLYCAKDEGRNRLFRADGREIVDSDSSRH
jgi:diguanylate cyclase (GGDEF)-like protein